MISRKENMIALNEIQHTDVIKYEMIFRATDVLTHPDNLYPETCHLVFRHGIP
jgi:hypothetical protein